MMAGKRSAQDAVSCKSVVLRLSTYCHKSLIMLGSWFGQKTSEDGTVEGNTPRPSFGSPSDLQPPRTSADRPPKRAFPTAFSTPHDAVLSELQGSSSPPAVAEPLNRPPSLMSEQVVSPDFPDPTREELPSRSENNVPGATPNSPFLPPPRKPSSNPDILLDPFDGVALGVLIPNDENKAGNEDMSPSQINLPSSFDAGQMGSQNAGSEAVWDHLSRILDLQSQISKKHLEMENIGAARGNDAKKKSHKLSTKNTPEASNIASSSSANLGSEDTPAVPPGLNRPRRQQRAMSTISTESSSDEPEGHEEGVNVPSEEAEKIRMREDEFAKLSTQFEGRKEAINDIMGKLDELSKALSEFHTIPTPKIKFYGSRQGSVGVTSPNIVATPPNQSNGNKEDTRSSPQDVPILPNQAFDWTTHQSTASSSPPRISQAASGQDKSEPTILSPMPSKARVQKAVVPTLLINSMTPGASLHDSPTSTGKSTLPDE
ncbi:hypothetical protein HYPSUDRAFT_722429 [Hypholoma sublateritium FD-334 SS-4]|uniref:Uncharacterized protein n=1 Tax=Hypholoma sublateritium (strain FD-334 SS-4) TaxID=945553 RepID=A0A0D2LLA6_HYPSF|nr:hypothetical protein HYPSUDRAFT_722429 [Hypholoma sublateritium FD-334 SS-4]